jgi:nitrate reductase molybdenum cofactor assembly chaperone NarJ/NarW
MSTLSIYDGLAAILMYPEADYADRVRDAVLAAPPEIAWMLQQFAEQIDGRDTLQLQELFTVTFDLNPVCSLELGWHLFGENYDRGLLLVKLRQLLAGHGVSEHGELPDHLASVLRLLARMDESSRRDFAIAIVLPAIGKMLDAFRDKQNPYQKVLEATKTQLRSLCPDVPIFIPQAEPVLRVLD